jgi:serine/threonine protein kinase
MKTRFARISGFRRLQMQHDFEGAQALIYMRHGTVLRRLKQTASARSLRMKASDVLLSLCHANLVRILHVSPDGDMHLERMQTSLHRHMRAGQPCSDGAKLKIARHATSALQHLHQQDLQHEDLCPNNILLAWQHGEMHVKLCDFYNEHTGCTRTAAYAAPEVVLLQAADVTAAADVWALVCCLLFMEGAEPFAGFDHAQAILLYLGTHLCVAFRELSTVTQFSLTDCAYGPAKHIAHSMWSDILGSVFVPEASRLSSAEVQHRLHALHAPKQPHARTMPKRRSFA